MAICGWDGGGAEALSRARIHRLSGNLWMERWGGKCIVQFSATHPQIKWQCVDPTSGWPIHRLSGNLWMRASFGSRPLLRAFGCASVRARGVLERFLALRSTHSCAICGGRVGIHTFLCNLRKASVALRQQIGGLRPVGDLPLGFAPLALRHLFPGFGKSEKHFPQIRKVRGSVPCAKIPRKGCPEMCYRFRTGSQEAPRSVSP